MSTARYDMAATDLVDGTVLVLGGFALATYHASADVFDPSTGLFAPTGPMSKARRAPTATRLTNGKVLVVGGSTGTSFVSEAELYDPSTRTFSATGSLTIGRNWHAATLLDDGRVLVAGGLGAPNNTPLATAEIYDPSTGTFTLLSSTLSVARQQITATTLADGRTLIAGGANATGTTALAEIFDPSTNAFTVLATPMASARQGHTATILQDGSVLFTGGRIGGTYLSSAEKFNPATKLFVNVGPMNARRGYHTATRLTNGRVLLTGGWDNAFTSAEQFDPETNLFTPTAGAMTSARSEHVAAVLPGNRVLVAGGYNGSQVVTASADVFDASTGFFSTFVFNPRTATPSIDANGDNIYNFTRITIPAGLTVRVSADAINGPVYWLSSGPVVINGGIDLSGAAGHPHTASPSVRVPSMPGAGGFIGGIGGNATSPAQAGSGPRGGTPSTPNTQNHFVREGGFSGNNFLVPLVGGSGGAGGTGSGANFGQGGGAGGGAILIASSVSIAINGQIRANGGETAPCVGIFGGGGGAGGGIRLAAPVITGNGSMTVTGGLDACAGTLRGETGRIRLEAFDNRFGGSATYTQASPYDLFLPTTPPPSVRVLSVAGVPVASTPTGSFTLPDVQINATAAVPVVIEAHQIPTGTVVELHLFSDNGADQVLVSGPLSGTLETSTVTMQVTFPPGFSRGYPRAVWR